MQARLEAFESDVKAQFDRVHNMIEELWGKIAEVERQDGPPFEQTLKKYRLLIAAMMDTLGTTQVRISRETLIEVEREPAVLVVDERPGGDCVVVKRESGAK